MESEEKKQLNLDLNEREQLKYIGQFMKLAGKSMEVAQAIQSGNTEEIMKTFMFFNLQLISLGEFQTVVTRELEKNIANKNDKDFPDIIFTEKP